MFEQLDCATRHAFSDLLNLCPGSAEGKPRPCGAAQMATPRGRSWVWGCQFVSIQGLDFDREASVQVTYRNQAILTSKRDIFTDLRLRLGRLSRPSSRVCAFVYLLPKTWTDSFICVCPNLYNLCPDFIFLQNSFRKHYPISEKNLSRFSYLVS